MSLDNDLTPDVRDAEIAAVTEGAAKRRRRARLRVSEGG